MFTAYVGKPVIAQCVQYTASIKGELAKLFRHSFMESPLGFCCLVGRTAVPLNEGDWILASKTFPDRFQVMTDKQFQTQFQKPEDIEVIP